MDQSTAEPVTANVDGWTVQSSSMHRPSEAELTEAISDSPPVVAAPPPAEPAVQPPAEDAAVVPPPAADAAPPVPTPPPAVSPAVQARIDKSIRAQRDAERDRDAARYRAEQLEREIASLRTAPPLAAPPVAPPAAPPATDPAAAAAAAPPTPPPAAGDTAQEPQWAEFEARGESWEDYQKAWRTWNHETTVAAATAAAQATVKERLEQAAKTDAAARHKHDTEIRFQARMDAMRAKNPDYDQLVAANEDLLAPLNSPYLEHLMLYTNDGADILLDIVRDPAAAAVLAEFKPTRAVVDAIGMSGAPRALLAHFAAHPDEMNSLIASSDPRTVFMTLGSLEARLTGAKSSASPGAVPATTPRPAPPLRPVAGVSTTAGAGSTAPGDDEPFGPEYVRKGNRADAERRRGL